MSTSRSLIVLAALLAIGCGDSKPATSTSDTATAKGSGSAVPKVTKLIKDDVKLGKGPIEVKEGDMVWVWYKGTLGDGTVFDAHQKPDEPVSFGLEKGGLIDGWIEGMPGMRVGGERKLSVPSKMGYGAQGQGDKIPANSDLFFDIELAYVVEPGKEKVFDFKDTKVGTGAEVKKGSVVKILDTGYLLSDKKVIDSSNPSKPESFTVGKGEVLQGLEYGIIGMKKGGKRTIMLPPEAAFGQRGQGETIPPNSPMRFEVEVLDVK